MAHLLCVRHCATILYLEYNIEKNGYDVCVLTAKGIVEVAHTTQVIILINYAIIVTTKSYKNKKQNMVLQSLLIQTKRFHPVLGYI